MQSLTERLPNRIDLIAGVAGILGGAIVAVIGYISKEPATGEMGAAVFGASALYLLLRRKLVSSTSLHISSNPTTNWLINIFIFSALAASFFLLHSLYRSQLYFILVSLVATSIAAEVLYSKTSAQTWLVLLHIMLLALSLRAGLFYEQPGLIGNDGWLHWATADTWMEMGRITPDVPNLPGGVSSYYDFPIMYLMTITSKAVTGLDYINSLFLSLGLPSILSIFFVYLIGKRLMDRKAGLLAALFIAINQAHISFGATLIPTTLGLTLFTVLLYLLFQDSVSSFSLKMLFLLLAVTLVLSHTISAFITCIVMLLMALTLAVYHKADERRAKSVLLRLNTAILFTLLMIARWQYSFRTQGYSFFESIVINLYDTLGRQFEFVGSVLHRSSDYPLNRVWFLIVIGFTVIGALTWLHPAKRDNIRTAIIISSMGVAALTFILPFFNINSFIPGRWVPFISVMVAAPAVQGILALSSIFQAEAKRTVVIVVALFCFAFLSLNSSGVNPHTPFYPEPATVAFTQSEISATETIAGKIKGELTTDFDYAQLLFQGRQGVLWYTYLDPEANTGDLVILRTYIKEHPEFVEYYQWRPGETPLEEARDFYTSFEGSRYFDSVYANDRVQGYWKLPNREKVRGY